MQRLARRARDRLRFPLKILADLVLWSAATPLAYMLRFDLELPRAFREGFWVFLSASVVLKLVALLAFRFDLRSWRKVTFRDVEVLVIGVAAVTALQLMLVVPLRPDTVVPLSIPVLDAAVGTILLFAVRAARRWVDERDRRDAAGEATPVLILGAGEAGTLLAREMLRHPETGVRLVGFVDDDRQKRGMRIAGVPVLGGRDELPNILAETPVDEVLIAVPSADGRFIRDTVQRVRAAGEAHGRDVRIRVMPGVYELISGDVSVDRLRDVRVEDLLRRAPVQLDLGAIRSYVAGRTVLVTGAGGSIGGELARQLARFGPSRLVLVGRGENSLFDAEERMRRATPDLEIEVVIASVADPERMRAVFERARPGLVFHAAAHKHVPLMEAHPEEAILNNVLGTRAVVEMALQYGVERFVNVSSDKAVNPASVMGASKRLAEAVVLEASARTAEGARFVSVRFGNVLGSRGSVVPLFRRQIEDGGPVTITDRRMTRYFMTIPEAAQLVLQAAALAENGAVYLLDMGEPVRIVDLAEDLIRLSGLEPYEDVDIVEVGARPGEKLREELQDAGAPHRSAGHDQIFVAEGPGLEGDELREVVEQMEALARAGRRDELRRALRDRGLITVPADAAT